jgi:hypothetical protein
MPYRWELYRVTGDTLRSAADDTEGRLASVREVVSGTKSNHQTALGAVDDQLDASVDEAPTGVITEANETERKAIFAAGCLKYFAHAVDTFNTNGISPRSVTKLNTDFETLIGSDFNVAQPDIPADATAGERQSLESGHDNAVAAKRTEVEAEFDREFRTLEGHLDDAATHASTMLNQGPTDENIKDLYSWGALPMTAALIFPDVDFSHQAMPPEQAQRLARYIAEQVEGGDIDANDVRLMGLYKENEDFSAEFYRQVTPDEISRAITDLSNDAFPYGSSSPPETYAEQRELYENFLVAAGTMLATYSRGTGDNAPPSNFADTWGNEIISEDPEDQHNAAALSLLFKHGQDGEFDSNFLADVTEIVYDYEQEHKDDGPIWGPRVGTESGSMHGPQDPFLTDERWFGEHNYDPLANLFTAMNESPEAAEIFFSRGGETDVEINGHDVQVNDRLQYLLVDRIWPTDDGDGMGQLLEGATIGVRDDGTSGEQAATLASQTMGLIAENSGQGSSIVPGDDGWHLPEGARDSVGNILASYMNDVFRGAQTDGDSIEGNNWVWGDDAGEDMYKDVYGLRISHEDLGVVLQDVGRGDDKTGITTVVTAALNYNNERASDYMAGIDLPPGQAPTIEYLREHNLLDGLSDQAASSGESLAFIIDRGLVGGQDQEASDQEVRDALSTAFGAATEFVPTPQGKVAGYLTTEGLSLLQDAIGNQPDSMSQAWAQDTDAAIKTSLQYQTYNALIQNGYLDVSRDPQHGIPPECLVPDGNGNMVIDPKLYNDVAGDVPANVENAFNAWDSGRNPSGVVQDFINAYSSHLPSFR